MALSFFATARSNAHEAAVPERKAISGLLCHDLVVPAQTRQRPVLPALVLVGAVGTCLLPGLRRPLWLDESGSAALATLPSDDLRHVLIAREGNGILHTLLLRVWSHVTTSDLGLRIPSLAFSVLALVLLVMLAQQLFDRRTAMLVPPLLVTNPIYIRYAVEARTYALVLALSCASGLLLVRAVRRPTRSAWIAYAALTATAAYAHYFAVLLVAGHIAGLALLKRSNIQLKSQLLPAGAVYVLLCAGLVPLLMGGGAGGVHYLKDSPFARTLILVGVGALPLALATGAAYLVRRRRRGQVITLQVDAARWPWAFLLAWLVTPVVLAVGYSAVSSPVLAPRYLIVSLPPAVLLTAAVATRLRWQRVMVAVVGATAVAGVFLGRAYVARQTEDWPGAARIVRTDAHPGDGVLFAAPYVRVPFERVYDVEAARRAGVQPLLPPLPWGASEAPLFFNQVLTSKRVSAATVGLPQVFVVTSHVQLYGSTDPTYDAVVTGLQNTFTLRETVQLRGVAVQIWTETTAFH